MTLKDKIQWEEVVGVKDIAQAIKKLKEEINKEWNGEGKCPSVEDCIDKIFGNFEEKK